MSAYRLVLPSARRLHYLHLNIQGGKAALPPSFLPGRKRLYGAPAPPTRRPVGCSSACLYGILKYPDCTLPPKQKATAKAVAFCFGFRPPEGGLHPSALECSGRRSRPSAEVLPAAKPSNAAKAARPRRAVGQDLRQLIQNFKYLDCSDLP